MGDECEAHCFSSFRTLTLSLTPAHNSPFLTPMQTSPGCVPLLSCKKKEGMNFRCLYVCVRGRVCLLRVDNCRCAAGCGVRMYDCAKDHGLGASPLLQMKEKMKQEK